MPDVIYEKCGPVAWIIINRPEAKNTLSPTAFVEMADAFRFEDAESAKVMVSQDAREGPRAFKEKREPGFKGA